MPDPFVPLPLPRPGGPLQSPFDETAPAEAARIAADHLKDELRERRIADAAALDDLESAGGKMFGVLVVEDGEGRTGYLRAFSGMLGGRFDVAGFVPAVFDPGARAAVEVPGERIVSMLTRRSEGSGRREAADRALLALAELGERHRVARTELRARHDERRRLRRERRASLAGTPLADAEREALAQQSRADKAERRRLEAAQALERKPLEREAARSVRRAAAELRLHGIVSRGLMRRIHDAYVLVNARGETRSLRSLFAPAEPPGGAADCAAPKLLAYAIAHGFRPLALAEFWWGAPPAGGGRVHGAFYPACREKCGPVLPFLLRGFDVAEPRSLRADSARLDLRVVFEDEVLVVVDKPCGLLSVPGKGEQGGDNVLARLRDRYPAATGPLLVHRLDLDTSGLLVAAKTSESHALLQKQFLRGSVRKLYVAIVEGSVTGNAGVIDLPLRGDPHDRPRQVVDPVHGKRARTLWSVIERAEGTVRLALRPQTGRTHQLRVHCAHPLGLGAPIAGDRLYGRPADRLLLHAHRLEFEHPVSGERMSFESPVPFGDANVPAITCDD